MASNMVAMLDYLKEIHRVAMMVVAKAPTMADSKGVPLVDMMAGEKAAAMVKSWEWLTVVRLE